MLKYLSKFAMDILPSVLATIIGAYIVNHYIAKPGADASSKVAAVSAGEPKKAGTTGDVKPSAISLGNLLQPGVKAKGISEKTMLEQNAAEKPATAEKPVPAEKPSPVEKPVTVEKPAEKSAEKPAETASIPVETRRHQPAPHERATAKSTAAPTAPWTAAASPVAAPNSAPSAEAAMVPEERRDANELARAAIERLRGASEASPRPHEAARVPDAPRVVSAPVASAPAVRPLPPPIMVSTPPAEALDAAGTSQIRPAYPAADISDPRRPTPPADIPQAAPAPGPLDLRAETVEPPRKPHTNVAEDVLLAAKSVLHAVMPK
jgi:hypothetical protein